MRGGVILSCIEDFLWVWMNHGESRIRKPDSNLWWCGACGGAYKRHDATRVLTIHLGAVGVQGACTAVSAWRQSLEGPNVPLYTTREQASRDERILGFRQGLQLQGSRPSEAPEQWNCVQVRTRTARKLTPFTLRELSPNCCFERVAPNSKGDVQAHNRGSLYDRRCPAVVEALTTFLCDVATDRVP